MAEPLPPQPPPEEDLPAVADPRVPEDRDWNVRPYSQSEHYVEPGIESSLYRDWPSVFPQVPSLLSLAFSLLGFLPGVWGLAAATFGMTLAALAITTPGATRRHSAWAGFALGLTWLILHAVAPR
jgi:hypothetical protein